MFAPGPNICRKWIATLSLLALFAILNVRPGLAQNGQRGSNSASSSLHISANIVAVAYPQTQSLSQSTSQLILYNVPVVGIHSDLMEERKTIEFFHNDRNGKTYLRTTTVVQR
jgi:hypothetical protein